MEMQLILVAFIVSLGLTFVQPSNHRISGGNDGSSIDENFHSLFDSIRKNNVEETETYRNALEQKAIKERQAFDTMKEQLQAVRQKSAQKQMRNSYEKNADIKEKALAFKRGVSDFSGEFPGESASVESENAGPVPREIIQLENLFLELHPNTDDIPWEEMANLTEESLKNICDQMLPVLVPSAKNYTYDGSLDFSDFRLERMVQHSLLRLKNQVVEVPAYAPIIKCFYKETKFYLTHAADGMVFEVQCEDPDQEIYVLKGGPYRVNVPR